MINQANDQIKELNDFFVNLFVLIGHDKEEAQQNTNIFVRQIWGQTIFQLLKNQTDAEKLFKKFSECKNQAEIGRFIGEHFKHQDVGQTLQQETKKFMNDYFSTISSELSNDQKVLINHYLSKFTDSNYDTPKSD